MQIRRLRIKNVRVFREVDLDFSRPNGSLSGWTVLAGRNGSGKTTLLRAIALAVAGPEVARALSPSFAGWVRQNEEIAEARAYLESQDPNDPLEKEVGAVGLTWNSEKSDEPQLGSSTTSKPSPKFNAVLLYNEADWEKVSAVATKLKSQGISPWLDRWSLRPGELIAKAYSNALMEAHAVVIFSGKYGPPELRDETFSLLRELAILAVPVIPVTIDKEASSVRIMNRTDKFLEDFIAVNFLRSEPDPMDALIWGITGERNLIPLEQIPSGFIVAYGPYRRLTGHAVDAQRLMEGPPPIARLVSLFREDASLVECIGWLREIYLRKLEEKPGAAELENLVLSLLNDGLLPDSIKVEEVNSEGLWVQQHSVRLPLQELSDGYRNAAALVMDIVRHLHQSFGDLSVEPSEAHESSLRILQAGIVLIDEVDLHLHVSWQKRIGFWLKHHFPNIQFIVTTHSPFVCQAADPGGLIRLPAPGENRSVEHVSESLYNTVVNGSIDDAVLTELFGLETPYSQETERLRERVAELETRLQTGEVSDNEKSELRELRSRLPKTLSSDVEQALRKLASER